MDKKNIKYKIYFKKLRLTLENLNNKFLFYIPDLYKIDFRKDKISYTKIRFNFLKLFIKNYLYEDIRKVKKAKICFISHYVGNKIKDKDDDFYYGSFFKNFQLKLPFYVLLINHTEETLDEIKKKFEGSRITRVYINNNFNLFFDAYVLFKIVKEFFYFSIIKFFNKKNKINNRIKFSFNLNDFFTTRFTYKISNQLTNVLNNSKNLKYIMTTFEGHAFEKIIFNYCKVKKIKSFAYFFSVIRQYKNNIYYKFFENYEPDIIFTSGDVANKDLKLNSHHKNIKTLGGNKNLSKKNKFNILKNKKINKLVILVCPEGIYEETIQMFKLINTNTLNNNDFEFIFRTHPVLDIFDELKKYKSNKNISFSQERDIKDDFKRSHIILYSGSSVCIQAIMYGLIPINYQNKIYNFSLDPLYKINKFIIKDSLSLKLEINLIYKKRFSLDFIKNIFQIKKYCNSYFKNLNQDVLIKSIDNYYKNNNKN